MANTATGMSGDELVSEVLRTAKFAAENKSAAVDAIRERITEHRIEIEDLEKQLALLGAKPLGRPAGKPRKPRQPKTATTPEADELAKLRAKITAANGGAAPRMASLSRLAKDHPEIADVIERYERLKAASEAPAQ